MEFYAVLDPFLMVGIVSSSSADELRVVDRDDVRRINGLIVKYSDEVVARMSSDLEGAWYRIFDGEEQIRLAKQLPQGAELVRLTVEAIGPDQQA